MTVALTMVPIAEIQAIPPTAGATTITKKVATTVATKAQLKNSSPHFIPGTRPS